MLFNSAGFLFYFLPLVLVIYYTFSFSRIFQNVWLLIASFIFYIWFDIKVVWILIFVILFNYIMSHRIHNRLNSKSLFIFTIIVNVSILFVFKYFNFTLDNLRAIGLFDNLTFKLLLPLGISFYLFKVISYQIDVYRHEIEPATSLINFSLYVVFFPQIIAGPIARYKQMEVQIRERKENTKRFAVGVQRFVVGLAKKTLIANALLIVADRVYGFLDTQTITMSLAWLGTIAYTLQIYFDFSGYSDMAIGIGLMFGFKTEENFNFPYIAQSINEFWRRWHISLSTWFKDYVYIPLGGSRVKNQDRIIANLLVVWVLTGLWHGSNWTFVLWGLFNFVVLVFERFVDFENLKLNRVLKHVYALVIINIAWVFFRSNSIYDAGKMLTSMIGVNGFFDSTSFMFIREFGIIFLLGFFFSIPIARRMNTMIVDEEKAKWAWIFRLIYPIVMILLFVLSVSTIIKGSYNPFIYFNF